MSPTQHASEILPDNDPTFGFEGLGPFGSPNSAQLVDAEPTESDCFAVKILMISCLGVRRHKTQHDGLV